MASMGKEGEFGRR
jgi:hypothetical protein